MIDWARVAELRDEIGTEDFDEVADLFLQEVGETIGRIGTLTARPRASAEAMHAVKGAAANLGFSALLRLAQAGERAALSGDTAAVTAAELRRVFDASVAVFETERAARLAA